MHIFFPLYRSIDATSLVATVERLRSRIEERFPGSGLGRVARELEEVARQSAARVEATRRPYVLLRVGKVVLVGLLAVASWAFLVPLFAMSRTDAVELTELVQAIESAVNDLVFVAIGIWFLASLESRLKRAQILAALHELRAIAHIIDMHHLTKDPERVLLGGPSTPSSPHRDLTPFELGRYLDYCTELLALVGKIAALYAQATDDTATLAAVDQIDDLTGGLTRTVWQKIMLLHQLAGDGLRPSAPAPPVVVPVPPTEHP
jgi:hypothetical protein